MNTIEEVIDFAIEKEAETSAFYHQLKNMAESKGSKETFEKLAKMEHHHQELLENLDMEKVNGLANNTTPDLKISDYLEEVEFTPDIKYRDILVLAMKAEEKSHRMYKEMAAQSEPDSDLHRLFYFLTEQEAKHKLMLETEYDDYVLQQD